MQELLEHIFSIFNGGKELFGVPLTFREKGILANTIQPPSPQEVGKLAYIMMRDGGVDEVTAVCTSMCLLARNLEPIILRRLSRKEKIAIQELKERIKLKGFF